MDFRRPQSLLWSFEDRKDFYCPQMTSSSFWNYRRPKGLLWTVEDI